MASRNRPTIKLSERQRLQAAIGAYAMVLPERPDHYTRMMRQDLARLAEIDFAESQASIPEIEVVEPSATQGA